MPIHRIYRDGQLYQELDSDSQPTSLMTQVYARVMPKNKFELRNEHGTVLYAPGDAAELPDDQEEPEEALDIPSRNAILLISGMEHWANSSEVQSVVDEAEEETGYTSEAYDEYRDEIAIFRCMVSDYINLNHPSLFVKWSHVQSVGVGHLLQNRWGPKDPDKARMQRALDSAISHARRRFKELCVQHCRSQLEVSRCDRLQELEIQVAELKDLLTWISREGLSDEVRQEIEAKLSGN